eukprot:5041794-Prymnesium_polylepis.2
MATWSSTRADSGKPSAVARAARAASSSHCSLLPAIGEPQRDRSSGQCESQPQRFQSAWGLGRRG